MYQVLKTIASSEDKAIKYKITTETWTDYNL